MMNTLISFLNFDLLGLIHHIIVFLVLTLLVEHIMNIFALIILGGGGEGGG